MRVLFLEDNELFAEALADTLTAIGWTVEHIREVDLAKKAFSERTFDLVIMDIHLKAPTTNRIDSGFDFLHFVRGRHRSQVPVVVTTGLELIKEESVLDYGADLFFHKVDIRMNDFVENLRSLVASTPRSL